MTIKHRLLPRHVVATYTRAMTNEDLALDEIQDNRREAGQRLRASLNLMRSRGMLDDSNFRELVTRLTLLLPHEQVYGPNALSSKPPGNVPIPYFRRVG
jgi:hypothetical protein